MKIVGIIFICLLLSVSLRTTYCENISDGLKIIQDFFEYIPSRNYEAQYNLMSQDMLKKFSRKEFVELMHKTWFGVDEVTIVSIDKRNIFPDNLLKIDLTLKVKKKTDFVNQQWSFNLIGEEGAWKIGPFSRWLYSCEGNMAILSRALENYALEHKGNFPAELAELYPDYLDAPQVFWTYHDDDPEPTRIDNSRPNNLNSAQISYIYTPGLSPSSSSDTIILKDNTPQNHRGKGIHTLSVGNQIEWIPTDPKEPRKKISRDEVERKLPFSLESLIGKHSLK